MSENEIKLLDALRDGCVCHAKRWSGDTHDELGGSIDQAATDALMLVAASAIDRLTAERDAAESQRNGYMKQHCRDSAELRAVCAERDEAQRKLSVAVANGNALVADMKRLSALEAAFYEAKALSEERAPEYQVAYNYILDRAAAIDPARAEGGV